MKLWLKMKILAMYGTQRRFAQICGKSDVWISRIIQGKRDPNEADKALIASRLGVDYDLHSLFVRQENDQ